MRRSRTGAFESFFAFDTREQTAPPENRLPRNSRRSEHPGTTVRRDGMIELGVDADREDAILVSVPRSRSREFTTGNTIATTEHPELLELSGLAVAAGVRVCGELVQYRETPDTKTFLGSGKVAELRELVDQSDATLVLFDQDLSPSQGRNLEKALKVRVLDRTELILDIFATRARTSEAKLAVELAQLEYSLPRLKRLWTHLERQTKGGVGLRGPGEKQLETDRRIAEKRISDLKRELNVVHERRQREAGARSDRMTVSLVGYTNAGKSTLMNLLTGADVLAEDALFCTLDTRTRRWSLPGWGPVLLSDTVGFIRDLPHHLIAS
ncbi:MAG: GTPase HflX, partial [Planctomycetia bacterium]|nr:GTPase HflX [Planctomycetia bacterium]